MDSDVGASVYAEAKGEYTKQLSLYLIPEFHRFFLTLLAQAQTDETNAKRHLWKFQELLSQIPEWNVDKVQRETSRLLTAIQCDYFEELITAVFIAHTKVLTAIRIGSKKSRVQIVVPKVDHFLHRALSECSRLLWSSAYLFHSELSAIEKQRNHRQIESLLNEGIGQAIRGLLPVKNILKDCIAETEGDAAAEAEEADVDDKEDDKGDDAVETKEPETIPTLESLPAEPLPTFAPPPVVEEALVSVSAPAPAPAPAPITEEAPVLAPVKEEPLPTFAPPAPVLSEASVLSEAPVVEEAPVVNEAPTLVVETSPSVKFTSYDQVIHINGSNADIQYVEKDRDKEPESAEIDFEDDDAGSLSDVEDLTTYDDTPLGNDDFETLP